MAMKVEAEIVSLTKFPNSNDLALVNVKLDGKIIISGVKVLNSERGLFAAMPDKFNDKANKYFPVVVIDNADLIKAIQDTVIGVYTRYAQSRGVNIPLARNGRRQNNSGNSGENIEFTDDNDGHSWGSARAPPNSQSKHEPQAESNPEPQAPPNSQSKHEPQAESDLPLPLTPEQVAELLSEAEFDPPPTSEPIVAEVSEPASEVQTEPPPTLTAELAPTLEPEPRSTAAERLAQLEQAIRSGELDIVVYQYDEEPADPELIPIAEPADAAETAKPPKLITAEQLERMLRGNELNVVSNAVKELHT